MNRPVVFLDTETTSLRPDRRGNGPGVSYGPATSGGSPAPGSGLSDEELARLLADAACRLDPTVCRQ